MGSSICGCNEDHSRERIDTDPKQEYSNTPITPMRDKHEVSKWLNNMKLGEYINNFVKNGFDDMNFIQTMDINTLKQIGITKMGHQITILSEIDNMTNHSYINSPYSPFYEQIKTGYNTINTPPSCKKRLYEYNNDENDNVISDNWICDNCNNQNGMKLTECELCGYELNEIDETLVKYLNVSNLRIKLRSNDILKWKCEQCRNMNGQNDKYCLKCGIKYECNDLCNRDLEPIDAKYSKIGINV
eukprot:200103_1